MTECPYENTDPDEPRSAAEWDAWYETLPEWQRDCDLGYTTLEPWEIRLEELANMEER